MTRAFPHSTVEAARPAIRSVTGSVLPALLAAMFLALPAPSAASPRHTQGLDREIKRCLRETYGPRYFARVRPAQRFLMVEACRRAR